MYFIIEILLQDLRNNKLSNLKLKSRTNEEQIDQKNKN